MSKSTDWQQGAGATAGPVCHTSNDDDPAREHPVPPSSRVRLRAPNRDAASANPFRSIDHPPQPRVTRAALVHRCGFWQDLDMLMIFKARSIFKLGNSLGRFNASWA
jgi:hypothetical protein